MSFESFENTTFELSTGEEVQVSQKVLEPWVGMKGGVLKRLGPYVTEIKPGGKMVL